MKKSQIHILFVFLLFQSITAFGQEKSPKYQPLKDITWNGYFRSFMVYRHLPVKYDDTRTGVNWFKVNGGYNEPLVRLNANINPTPQTALEIEYTFDNLLTGQLTGNGVSGESGRVTLPLQSLRLNAQHKSKFGQFNLQAGGIRFYTLSPLTFGGFSTVVDIFERVPWEGEDQPWTKYKKYFGKNQSAQANNSRFGAAIFQGFILEGRNMPFGFGMTSMFGKSINSGGFQAWTANNPKKVQVHRLTKKFDNLGTGATFYNSFGKTAENERTIEGTRIITTDYELSFKGIAINAEFGYGDYQNPLRERAGGEIAKLDIGVGQNVAGANIDLQAYRISENVLNQNSEFINTSISTASNQFGDVTNLGNGYLPGVITDFRQLSNNRQGINLKISRDFKSLKASIGLSSAQELTNANNAVTFQHNLNKDARSRFNIFQTGVGPYGRITSIYLTTFETIGITDTAVSYLKSYNTAQLRLKYNAWLFNKEIVLITNTHYNTVQDEVKALPTAKNPFVGLLFSDIQAFIHVRPKLVLLLMAGIERAKGSDRTELALNGQAIDQTGTALGLGLDIELSNRAALFLKHRWMSHSDQNFTEDKFKGTESSIEFKVFF